MSFQHLLPEFVTIPATPFLMGTPERELSALARAYGGTRESYREESPQCEVCLPAFQIAKTLVTNSLYAAYVAATGTAAPAHWRGGQPPEHLGDHPVVEVNWQEAQAFCAWLSQASGRRMSNRFFGSRLAVGGSRPVYRLPSEAEWEHAARGGDGRSFPWGNEWRPDYANTSEGGAATTTPVGAYPQAASPYGCQDMCGNVWEWTASLDRVYPYNQRDGREQVRAAGRRILRGGCYANPHGYARCACRFRLGPLVRNAFLGFRLACSV